MSPRTTAGTITFKILSSNNVSCIYSLDFACIYSSSVTQQNFHSSSPKCKFLRPSDSRISRVISANLLELFRCFFHKLDDDNDFSVTSYILEYNYYCYRGFDNTFFCSKFVQSNLSNLYLCCHILH